MFLPVWTLAVESAWLLIVATLCVFCAGGGASGPVRDQNERT